MIEYSDGAVEERILALVRAADSLGSDVDVAVEHYGEWPIHYHLTATRANAVRHLEFSGLDVLELGAGMGGVSRFFAEHARHLDVVEGAPRRLMVLKERLRDLDNWHATLANFQDFATEKRYDVVCFCGVLEYAGKYIRHPDPFRWALRHARSFLKPGGVLLALIENKNGYKYLAGAAEDHYGRKFAGICGYPARDAATKTFSLLEMRSMFQECGFPVVDVHHLWPDYKLAQAVLLDDFVRERPELCAGVAASYLFRDYHDRKNTSALYPQPLALASLAASGLLPELSNSYLFLATEAGSESKRRLLSKITREKARAFLYSALRKYNVASTFKERDDALWVEKRFLSATTERVAAGGETLHIEGNSETPCFFGKSWFWLLLNHWYYDMGEFFPAAERFFAIAFKRFAAADPQLLRGEAFDAIFQNAIIDEEKGAVFFDLEFRTESDIEKSWYVLRNCMSFAKYLRFAADGKKWTVKRLYSRWCDRLAIPKQWKRDLQRERRYQGMINQAVKRTPKRTLKGVLARGVAALLPVRSWRRRLRMIE